MSIFKAANILLPKNVDFSKWSVVACDQYSSEPEYWAKAAEIAKDSPSTLNIIYPEAYLNEADGDERIKNINETMQSYIDSGIFKEYKDSMIYVERTQKNGKIRRGIIGCIDLEAYDYSVGSTSPVRATEGTIISRIPPRQRIRRNAPLELPHILMLVDDRGKEVIEPIAKKSDKLEVLYDFDLMQGGGHIKGMLLDEDSKAAVLAACERFEDKEAFETKYGVENKSVLAIAVGDGNHSLATAKECSNLSDSPLARSALVEVVNIHDDSIQFEPIYRVLFGVEPELVIAQLAADLGTDGEDYHKFICCFGDEECELHLKPTSKLPVGTLQTWLDDYIKKYNVKIDYIHGEDVVRNLSKEKGNLGFIFDGMRKDELFPAVLGDGSLPRKTFSMGHAADKRYYIEARKIK